MRCRLHIWEIKCIVFLGVKLAVKLARRLKLRLHYGSAIGEKIEPEHIAIRSINLADVEATITTSLVYLASLCPHNSTRQIQQLFDLGPVNHKM